MKASRQFQKKPASQSAPVPSSRNLLQSRPFQDPAVQRSPHPEPTESTQTGKPLVPNWNQIFANDPRPAVAVQPKLTVGAPNDQYEQEADRVADQVMSMPDSATQQPLQRETMPEEEEIQAKPLSATITPLVQREAMPEEEEPVQTKSLGNATLQREAIPEEEEEPVQAKSLSGTLQREAMPEEEEEPVQTKSLETGMLQREAMPEEEEPVQTKSLATGTLQREAMPEEEEVQTKPLSNSTLQREALPEEEEPVQTKSSTPHTPHPTPSLENQLNNSQGSGSPLPDDVRAFMEPRFGADFSQVRVHTNSTAIQMNRDLNAQAFTHKQDLYFGAGKTPANDALTAHELTHVMQQTGNNQSLQRKVGDGHDLQSPRFSGDLVLESVFDDERHLRPGENGEHVVKLQQALLELDSSCLPKHGVDGIYGPETSNAVQKFQIQNNLAPAFGNVGPKTIAKLDQQFLTKTPTQTPPNPSIIPVGFQRKDFALIMGKDRPGSKNKAFTSAKKFFAERLPREQIIEDVHSFEGIFRWLRTLPPHSIANLFIVTHALEGEDLKIPLTDGDKNQTTSFGALKADIRDRADQFKLSGQIDNQTSIHIKGCQVGRSQKLLNLIDKAFGGFERVTAPTHKQDYEFGTKRSGGKAIEFFSVFFVEFPKNVTLNKTELAAKFAEKYAELNLDIKKWKLLVEGAKKKLDKRFIVEMELNEFKTDQEIESQSKLMFENNQKLKQESKDRQHQDEVLSRPEAYGWQISPSEDKRKKLNKKDSIVLVTASFELTTYSIDKPIEDDQHRLVQPQEKRGLFVGESDFDPNKV